MSVTEVITFDRGIIRKKSTLLLGEGELYSCNNFNLEKIGELSCRNAVSANEQVSSVSQLLNGINRYGSSIIASSKEYCPGNQSLFNYIYQRSTSGSYSNIALMAGSSRPSFANYENFMFCVDGESKKAFIDGNAYNWGIENPESFSVEAGAAGNPDGDYYCYVTFRITFPNDKVVETGPTDAVLVTTTTQAINWSNIPICNYEGEGLIIHRRLWRTVSGIAYLSKTITDNVTTTYTDDETDANLQLSTILDTDSYSIFPDGLEFIVVHNQRIFGIKGTRVYWSEAYAPFNMLDTSNIVVTESDETLTGLISWGNQLYLSTTRTWRRLQGADPETWALKGTFATRGIVNGHTIKDSRYGILGLWFDGVYNFDGNVSKNITEEYLGRKFFTDITDWSNAYAEFDGQIYSLIYSSSGGDLDSHLKLDFTEYPKLKIYNTDFISTAYFLYKEDYTKYYCYDTYEYLETGTETIPTDLRTGDFVFKDVLTKKCLEYLFYDIDTNGEDVTVTFYVDGVVSQSLTLNESSRARKRSMILPNMEGYSFYITIECEDSSNVVIYAPWALTATKVGE